MGDLAWFEEGRWPLESKWEISHHNFEDLRKRLLIWKYPYIGKHPYATTNGNYGVGQWVEKGNWWEMGKKPVSLRGGLLC